MKYVEAEFYCGENDFLGNVYLDFDDNATDADIDNAVEEEFDCFIEDMARDLYAQEYSSIVNDYEAFKDDIAITCNAEWKYCNSDDFVEEEHEYDWRNRE